MNYFKPTKPGQTVRAVPGAGLNVPIWILGSSLFGAQLAAELGLPFAFASHFAPAQMMQAIELYRSRFRPSLDIRGQTMGQTTNIARLNIEFSAVTLDQNAVSEPAS